MKKTFIVILFCISFQAGFSQGAFLRALLGNSNTYKTRHPLFMERVYDNQDNRSIVDTSMVYILKPRTRNDFIRYKVVKDDDDYFYIKVLPYITDSMTTKIDTTYLVFSDRTPPNDFTRYYFKVATEDLLPHQKYLATERIMGMPITLPVKFRKDDGNLRGEFELSIGYAFGYRIRVNNNPYLEQYINLIPYGFSFNADNYVPTDAPDDFDEISSFSLTYWTSGITYEVRKFNIGVFIGRDRMFNDRSDWVYQNKTWMSLGIGFKFGSDE